MLKLDQRGMSLPIVIGVAALILANSYYFMSLNRSSQKTAIGTKTEVSEQSEQSRIAGALSDLNICTSSDNFGGKNLASMVGAQIPFPIKRNSINILELNKAYSKDTHVVSRFQLEGDSSISNAQLRYSLVVTYNANNNVAAGVNGKASLPKRSAVVKVPLFIETDGSGNITRCYARPTQDTTANSTAVEIAVAQACVNGSSTTPLSFKRSTAGSAIAECVTNVEEKICGTGQVFNGLGINTSNTGTPGSENRREASCLGYSALCTSSPVQLVATNISSSNLTCSDPANGICTGSAMIRNSGSGSGISCSTSCSTAHLLFNSYNANGSPNCLNATTSCPAGQYPTGVDSVGNVTGCAYVQYRGKSCGANQYATDIDPSDTANPFKCAAYTRTRTCSGTFNFATSFNTTGIGCTNYNY